MKDVHEKEALRKHFNETVEKFEKYYNDPKQHHKIFTELGFTYVDDGCDGFCPECEQKLKCEIYDELKNDHEKLSDPEDIDEYRGRNIFWVPPEARWEYLQKNAKQPTIGVLIDDAMDSIERDNSSLKGVLPKNYARSSLDKQRLGELIDLVGKQVYAEYIGSFNGELKKSIDLGSLANGIYLLEVNTDKGNLNKKVIVNRD